MSPDLQRATLLRERGRHEEAVAFLLSHLTRQPEDAWAFIELALNRSEIPGQLKQALEDIRTATGLLPSEPFPLALQSRILCDLNKPKPALELADSAIALDPEFGYAWVSKCLALVEVSEWKAAEECARKALEIDPDDDAASNLLAHSLRLQNRLDESEDESNRRLARNPENAFSFATAGWAALQRGDVPGAEAKFREALRIEPDMEYAREGLKHSYRARSAFFRMFLKWSFFIQSVSEKHRTLLIISLVVGFNIMKTRRLRHPSGARRARGHRLLHVPFRQFPFQRTCELLPAERSGGKAFAGSLRKKSRALPSAVLVFGGCAGSPGRSDRSGSSAGCHRRHDARHSPARLHAFHESLEAGQAVFGLICLTSLVIGAVMAYDVFSHPDRVVFADLAGTCLTAIIVLCAGSTWLSMVPALREEKPG